MAVERCPNCKRPWRSGPQHRRLFGVVRAAYQNWPEKHEFQPSSSQHLRAWLLVKAGWLTEKTIVVGADVDEVNLARLLEGVILASGAFPFLEIEGHRVKVRSPKSQKFELMSHTDACWVFNAIDEVLQFEIGVSGNELLEHTEEAA